MYIYIHTYVYLLSLFHLFCICTCLCVLQSRSMYSGAIAPTVPVQARNPDVSQADPVGSFLRGCDKLRRKPLKLSIRSSRWPTRRTGRQDPDSQSHCGLCLGGYARNPQNRKPFTPKPKPETARPNPKPETPSPSIKRSPTLCAGSASTGQAGMPFVLHCDRKHRPSSL